MLRLRLSVSEEHAERVVSELGATEGVRRLVRSTAVDPAEVVVLGDVAAAAADRVVVLIDDLGVPSEDYILARQDVIAPTPARGPGLGSRNAFAWVEVMGEARANSRPLARYLAMISVAAVIAALGVLKGNGILIVGAMAVSPDLLPICAACVGIVGGRRTLARRASVTLTLGLGLVVVVGLGLSAALDSAGAIPASYTLGEGGLTTLAHTDYSTVLVALAAGVAAMLSFETRASAAVGVAISVTTIPASAYAGVAFGLGEPGKAKGALAVLAVNVILLLISGSATLATQMWFTKRRAGTPAAPPA